MTKTSKRSQPIETTPVDNVVDISSRRGVIGANEANRAPGPGRTDASPDRRVYAVVTVTRFIGDEKVQASVPVFTDALPIDLSELLADGAFKANDYLNRAGAVRGARPLADFDMTADALAAHEWYEKWGNYELI